MKNLKKVLALVMAFAMAFTMMATAGAAYTDQADIEATEAVDTLTALNVMAGDPDGSFRPNDTVSRAEMCRMIYTIRSGGNDDASSYVGMQTTFQDIPEDAWYAGYVKYCQSVGIVSGTSATTFEPTRDVTGVEAALMCLRVMGYDPARANIGGSTWSTTTIGLATENGLLDDVTASVTAGLPRQFAAQIMYNMLDASTVRWSTDSDSYSNVGSDNTPNETVGHKYMSLNTVEGVLADVSKEDGKDTYSMEVIDISKQNGTTVKIGDVDDITFTKVADDYFSLKDMKVKVLYKNTDEVYGVYALSDSNTLLTGKLADFEMDSTKLKYDGVKYNIADTNSVKVDNTPITDSDKDTIAEYLKTTATGLSKTYSAKALSNTDSNKINLFAVEGYALAQVTYVGSDYINVSYKSTTGYSFSTKLEADDANYPSDIEKDDYVTVTPADNTSDGNIGVTKLDIVTGKIDSTKNNISDDDYQIQIDGTWYEAAMNSASDYDDLKLDATVAIVVNGDYAVWVDDANAGATDIAMVVETYQEGNTHKATLLFADGTTETVSLKRNAEWDNDNDGTYSASEVQTVDAYSSSSAPILVGYSQSAGSYKLQTISNTVNPTSYDLVTAKEIDNTVSNNRLTKGDARYIDDNAVVFVRYKSGTDYKFSVQTGNSMKDWNSSREFDSVVLANSENGVYYGKVILADVDGGLPGGSDLTYAYIFSSKNTVDSDGSKYVEYDAWNGSEALTLKVEEDSASAQQGDIVEYTINGEDIADIEVYTPNNFGVLLNGTFNGSKVEGSAVVASTDTNNMISKTEAQKEANQKDIDISYDDDESYIFFVDTSEDTAEGNGRATADQTDFDTPKEDGDNYVANVAYYQNGDKVLMVVDVDLELNADVYGLSDGAYVPVTNYNVSYDSVSTSGNGSYTGTFSLSGAATSTGDTVEVTVAATADADATASAEVTLSATNGDPASTVSFSKAELISGKTKTVNVTGITTDTTISASAVTAADYATLASVSLTSATGQQLGTGSETASVNDNGDGTATASLSLSGFAASTNDTIKLTIPANTTANITDAGATGVSTGPYDGSNDLVLTAAGTITIELTTTAVNCEDLVTTLTITVSA